MNWLDFAFLLFLVIFAFQGLAEGFSRLIVGLVATIAGLLIASWCYDVPAAWLLPYVSSRAVANVLSAHDRSLFRKPEFAARAERGTKSGSRIGHRARSWTARFCGL